MSHAESAPNWAFGPWHFMRGGDPRHRKLEHLERLAAMRQLGEPFGGGGPMWGRGGPFGGGRGRGRKRRGDVRAALLLLLAEEARNGYQLMQTIEERSGGRWRPSPGSVYPALAQLEDEGLVRAVERDGTKLFELAIPDTTSTYVPEGLISVGMLDHENVHWFWLVESPRL